jgi:hypothetical protein
MFFSSAVFQYSNMLFNALTQPFVITLVLSKALLCTVKGTAFDII